MIDVKEAVKVAVDNLTELFSDQEYDNVLLEEIEPDSDEANKEGWLVTLGFDVPISNKSPIQNIMRVDNKRRYKVFKINSSGDLLSIKIREVQFT